MSSVRCGDTSVFPIAVTDKAALTTFTRCDPGLTTNKQPEGLLAPRPGTTVISPGRLFPVEGGEAWFPRLCQPVAAHMITHDPRLSGPNAPHAISHLRFQQAGLCSGLSGLRSRCWQAALLLGGSQGPVSCFFRCWQNSVPHCRRTELPVLLVAVT